MVVGNYCYMALHPILKNPQIFPEQQSCKFVLRPVVKLGCSQRKVKEHLTSLKERSCGRYMGLLMNETYLGTHFLTNSTFIKSNYLVSYSLIVVAYSSLKTETLSLTLVSFNKHIISEKFCSNLVIILITSHKSSSLFYTTLTS